MRGPRPAQGVGVLYDPARPRPVERDTYTCSHCQRVVMMHDENGKRVPAVLCYQCDKWICVPCAEQARCTPFEKWLEQVEGRAKFRSLIG